MIFLIAFPLWVSSLFSLKMAFAVAQLLKRMAWFCRIMQKAF
jgi:hypothetical protein